MALEGYAQLVESIAYVSLHQVNDLDSQQSVSTLVHTIKVMVQLPNKGVNKEEAKAEILEKIKYYEGFVQAINKKLGNAKFVENAPADVIEKERKKLADSLSNIESLKKELE